MDSLVFLMKLNRNLIMGGIVSPNKYPHGLRDSIWSKIILIIAIKGIDKNMLVTPHSAPLINFFSPNGLNQISLNFFNMICILKFLNFIYNNHKRFLLEF